MLRSVVSAGLLAFALSAVPAVASPMGGDRQTSQPDPTASNRSDYPAQARQEYVDVCSTVNGRTPEAARSCACSIDVIASILPFADYERAETVLRMRQLGGGYLAQEFRVQQTNDTLQALRDAQAEAEVRCF